jgi:hypothetical protein
MLAYGVNTYLTWTLFWRFDRVILFSHISSLSCKILGAKSTICMNLYLKYQSVEVIIDDTTTYFKFWPILRVRFNFEISLCTQFKRYYMLPRRRTPQHALFRWCTFGWPCRMNFQSAVMQLWCEGLCTVWHDMLPKRKVISWKRMSKELNLLLCL